MRYLYFIAKGEAIIKDREENLDLVFLPKNSWFGDYQVFMGSRSNVSFYSSESNNCICLCIAADDLIEYCH